jgi:hypothetical protein
MRLFQVKMEHVPESMCAHDDNDDGVVVDVGMQ